jgi:hypothetical protein
MKQFKLIAWPELPAAYQRTAYRRMLSDMSHRYMSAAQLVSSSGLPRQDVRAFIEMLQSSELLREREVSAPDSLFDSLAPIGGWIVRALTSEIGRR